MVPELAEGGTRDGGCVAILGDGTVNFVLLTSFVPWIELEAPFVVGRRWGKYAAGSALDKHYSGGYKCPRALRSTFPGNPPKKQSLTTEVGGGYCEG